MLDQLPVEIVERIVTKIPDTDLIAASKVDSVWWQEVRREAYKRVVGLGKERKIRGNQKSVEDVEDVKDVSEISGEDIPPEKVLILPHIFHTYRIPSDHLSEAVYSKETFKKFIIRWIVKNDLPFTCVESEDFRNMISLLRKDAFIPSADTIKNYIMTSFNDNQKKLLLFYSKISFTIDAWTSSNNFSFLGITAHWVTENWKLKSFLLDFIKLEGPHSGANIKDAFLKSLKNFNIESKILGVTTDNASSNITFLKAVESDLSQRYIYYDSNDKHVRCLAHVINLAAQQVLTTLKATDNDESSNEEVGSLIVKLRTLIKKIKASPQQVDKFKAQCKVANVPNLNVILDVRTRWNSTYDMLVTGRMMIYQ
ncbi:unnamed protein product [Rhizophagus irregularis]|nr:unnamed protein product [Rhizophagus irregularis]